MAASSRAAVALRWTRGSRRAHRFRVLRNGRGVRTIRRLRMVDRGARAGRVQRYRIVGLDRRGRAVSRSRPLVIRAGRRHRSSRLRVSLASPRADWRRMHVDVRRLGRWRRLADRAHLRRRMSFALPARRRAVRVLVTSVHGRVLSSRPPA